MAAIPESCRGPFCLERSGDELLIHRRTGSFARRTFLRLFLAVWTATGVCGANSLAGGPTELQIVYGTLVLVTWLLVIYAFALQVFGAECLRIGPDGVEHRSKALITRSRRVPLREVRGLSAYSVDVGDEVVRLEFGLRIDALGKPIRFGKGATPDELSWLAEQVRRHLQILVPDRAIKYRAQVSEKDEMRIVALRPGQPVPERPSDSLIELSTHPDRIEFVLRTSFRPGLLVAITVTGFFWNALVGVFAIGFLNEFLVALVLFLIPFEVVGLLMIAAWWWVLLEPLWVRTLSIGRDEILLRRSILGLGWTQPMDTELVDRIEVWKRAADATWIRQSQEFPDDPFSVVFLDGTGRYGLVIRGLTKGESRWIGGTAYVALKRWLIKADSPDQVSRTAAASLWDRELDG